MKVLFASSEIFPYAKSGGLADVSDALPAALAKSVDIFKVMPFYGFMKRQNFKVYENFTIMLAGVGYEIEILQTKKEKIVTYFVNAPLLSSTLNLYGDEKGDYENNDLRFGIFCKALVELSVRLGITVLHLNDWHTALSTLFIKESNLKIKTIFTIHNLAYQGVFDKYSLWKLAIDEKYFRPDALEYYGKANFLKAGIAYSNFITTVSPTYAKEILTSEFGCGLDGFLRKYKEKLTGILNGINIDIFNPLSDKVLEFQYDKESLENKYKNKASFLKQTKLKDPRKPLFIMISRLVEQKGVSLLIASLDALLSKKLNFLLLGDGDKQTCEKLTLLASQYENFEFIEGHDEFLSHEVYAAADFLLMPSLFEPCGLNQFIAMRYGAVALVHSVGGLKDSICEFSDSDILTCARGIVFKEYNKESLLFALERALELKKDSQVYKSIVETNMQCDFSFDKSAAEYLKLYTK